MRKHRKLLITLACLAVVAAAIAFAARDNEPQYQGKSLSEWLDSYRSAVGTPGSSTPQAAVLAIGTNAIPTLLEWLRYEPNRLQRTASSRLPPAVVVRTALGRYAFGVSGVVRGETACIGFHLLETNAIPAIPRLVAMAKDKTHQDTARRSAKALRSILFAAARFNERYRSLGDPELVVPFPADIDILYERILQIAPELLTNAPAK